MNADDELNFSSKIQAKFFSILRLQFKDQAGLVSALCQISRNGTVVWERKQFDTVWRGL